MEAGFGADIGSWNYCTSLNDDSLTAGNTHLFGNSCWSNQVLVLYFGQNFDFLMMLFLDNDNMLNNFDINTIKLHMYLINTYYQKPYDFMRSFNRPHTY